MITLEEAFSFDHIIRAYFHCRKGKSYHRSVIDFHRNYLTRLYQLQHRILTGKYQIGHLYQFVIYEPKKRFITASEFEDKIVQRVICKYVLEPLLSKTLIYDNYASQPDKGTHLGLHRLTKHMRAFSKTQDWKDTGWVYNGDISKFFYTIHKTVCIQLVNQLDTDDAVKQIIYDQITAYDPSYNEYSDDPDRGICIGFQTSQWLAVYYLNGLDHYIKEQLHIKYYGRYMDDFYLIHEDRTYLTECIRKISAYITDTLQLTVNPKSHIYPYKEGICFLGYHATYNPTTHQVDVAIRNKSVKRMKHRTKRQLKLIRGGILPIEKVEESLQSWHAYAIHGLTDRAENAYRWATGQINTYQALALRFQESLNDPANVDKDGFYLLKYRDTFSAFPVPLRQTKLEYDAELSKQKVLADPEAAAALNLDLLMSYVNKPSKPKKKKRDPNLDEIASHLDYTPWEKSSTEEQERDQDGFITLRRKRK